MQQGGSIADAYSAIRLSIVRTDATNRSNEVFPDPPMRQGTAGIGYKQPVLASRHLHDKSDWDKVGKPPKFIQIFLWNVGNLQRSSKCNTLNDLLAPQFHISCIQEATILSGQQLLFESRGIRNASSRDRSSMINAGGTGIKVIEK